MDNKEQATKHMEFAVTTNRDALVLNYEGYRYMTKREYNNTNGWKCQPRPCTTSLSLSRKPDSYICASSSARKVVLAAALSRMNNNACEETLPIPQIYAQEIIKAAVNHPDSNTGVFISEAGTELSKITFSF